MKFRAYLDIAVDGQEIGMVNGELDFTVEPMPGDLVSLAVVDGVGALPHYMPMARVKARLHHPLSQGHRQSPHAVFFEPLEFEDREAAIACITFLENEADFFSELWDV